MKIKSISFKLGLWFSTIFLSLLLILGFILYGVFTNFFTDYIEQDLVAKGNNHAQNLEKQFTKSTINHAIQMEQGVSTKILITNNQYQIISSSIELDEDIIDHIFLDKPISTGQVIENDWKNHEYCLRFSCW